MKVRIINPVQHDTRELPPGVNANIPDSAAKALISIGAAEPINSSTSEQSPGTGTPPAQNPDPVPNPEAVPIPEPAQDPASDPIPEVPAPEGSA